VGAWTITRKATEQVTTIGIDIGKNSFHHIGPNVACGSTSDSRNLPLPRPELGVKRT
jgi:hypothetical protein